jgi:hypothetical protein
MTSRQLAILSIIVHGETERGMTLSEIGRACGIRYEFPGDYVFADVHALLFDNYVSRTKQCEDGYVFYSATELGKGMVQHV